MTIIIPAHRALTTKLAGRSYQVVTRYGYNPWLARVSQPPTSNSDIKSTRESSVLHRIGFTSTRTYATTTAKTPGRPKAHTGRTPARKSTRTTTAKKPGPKTAAGKAKVGRKPTTKAKAKPKAKGTTVKKVPSKRSIALKATAKQRELKEKALLDPPKDLPRTAYTVLFSEITRANKGTAVPVSEGAKQAAAKFKNLTPEEKEHYNHVANQNKEKNDRAYKQWLSTFTPEQIKEANNARRQLRAQYKEKKGKGRNVKKFANLQDDRLVKRPMTAFILFSQERRDSGDFHRMSIAESSKLIGREWQELDAASRKRFEDQYKADHNRYTEELKTVYGIDFKPKSRAKKAA